MDMYVHFVKTMGKLPLIPPLDLVFVIYYKLIQFSICIKGENVIATTVPCKKMGQ